MKYANHGYIGYDVCGGPQGVIRPGDIWIRSLPTPIQPEGLSPDKPATSFLQAATLVFSNNIRVRVDYEIGPTGPTPI